MPLQWHAEYGPALRGGPEDRSIDAWCKRVARPVLDKWYFEDRTAGISYHKDHGEGLDAYLKSKKP